ncbi:MAG: MBL fold metallo-hydrolase [Acidobacteriota bacterium]
MNRFVVLFAALFLVGSAVCADDDRAVYETEIDAPIEAVWAAFTTTDGLRSWMAPLVEIELKVGGTLRANYNAEGALGDATTIENTILAFDPPRMLSLKATGFPDGFPFEEAATSTWSVFYFDALSPSRTKITVVGLGYTDDEPSQTMRSFFAAANEQSLGQLASALKPSRWCDLLPRASHADLVRVPIADDWFVVYRAAPDVLAILEPYQWEEVVSYLILGEERALLFDTGMGISDIRAVVEELTSLPVTVLNSHTHFDHIGGNSVFDHVLAMDTDYTRKHAREGVGHDIVKGEVEPAALCRPLPDGFDATTYAVPGFTIHETIGDGHRIDLGGRVLEVLGIPGHSPDSVALLDAEAGYLWTGDSFYEALIYLSGPGTDLDAYGRSIDRLAALAPSLTMVFPGHNTVVAKPDGLIAVRDAFVAVRAGEVEGVERGGRVRYTFDGFGLLLRSQP